MNYNNFNWKSKQVIYIKTNNEVLSANKIDLSAGLDNTNLFLKFGICFLLMSKKRLYF